MTNPSKISYYLNKSLFNILQDTYGGTFYKKGSTEYFFRNLIITKKNFTDENNHEIIYPHILLRGKGLEEEIIELDLIPLKIQDILKEKHLEGIENLKGSLKIKGKEKYFFAKGTISDYWNGTFWIDKPTIKTNIEDYKNKSTFLFQSGYSKLKKVLANTNAKPLNITNFY